MPRRLSASIFLLGMALLVLLKQPVLAYCACAETFLIEKCDCAEAAHDHCPCSPCHEAEEVPCDDCGKRISLDLDDHFWDPLNLPSNSEQTDADAIGGKHVVFSPRNFYALPEVRPPPPPSVGSLPLYLSLGVLRL